MSKIVVVSIPALLFAAGCESSGDRAADTQPGHYQPTDGRNLGPGLQEASHGDPQFPADVARGGGGGMR